MRTPTEQQSRFCEYYVAGVQAGRAYEKAGFKAKGRSADAAAARMLTKANIVSYVGELREEAKKIAVMTIQERVVWLSQAIVTPLSDIDDTSNLCSEKTVRVETDKDGKRVADIEKIKKVDALRALDMLNKMTGGYEPEKHKLEIEVTIGGNAEG